jgi:hypothetical protein
MKIQAISAAIAVTIIFAGCGKDTKPDNTRLQTSNHTNNTTMSFTPDDKIQKIAEAYSLDACDFLTDHFNAKLDWSDSSVQQIESVLDTFHKDIANAKPTDEQIMGFSKMFGSYIGEVYRKNHGATWGIVHMNGESFPGLKADLDGTLFWPWGRTRNRLVDGAENNVWHYYSQLPTKPGAAEPPKKGWKFWK